MDFISPIPLSPEDRPYRQELYKLLVADLFQRTKAALIFLILVMAIIWQLLGVVAQNHPVLPWLYLATGGIVLLRLASIILLERWPHVIESPAGRHALFLAGSTLAALALGMLNWLMVPLLEPIQLALLCLILTGINSVAVQSMAGSPVAFALYMTPILGTFALRAFSLAITEHMGVMMLLVPVYYVALIAMSLHVHASLRRSFLQGLKLGDLALRDSLTGLRNRRFLQEFMETEVERALRTWSLAYHGSMRPSSSLAILILDLDHFKDVNDTYGHEAGDEVLRQVSLILRDVVRKPDLVTRWGGEEFVIVAVDILRTPHQPLTERIRLAVESHPFSLPQGPPIHITCSVGFAFYPFLELDPEGMAWDQVLNLADGALYLAKREGRNRVCGVVAGPALIESPRALISVGKNLLEPAKAGLVGLVRRGA